MATLRCSICGAVDTDESREYGQAGETFLVLEREVWQGFILICCTGCHSEIVRAKISSPLYIKYLGEYAICSIIEATPLGMPPLIGKGSWEEMREKLTEKINDANTRIYACVMDLSKFLREHVSEMRAKHQPRDEV